MAERIFTRDDAKSVIRSNTEKVKLPSDFTVIGKGSLAGFSQMKELIIPEGITRIESHAFFVRSFKNTSNLERLTIPASLTDFELWCFFDCNQLKSISLPDGFPEQKIMELFYHVPEATVNFGKKLLFAAKSKTVAQIIDEQGGSLTLGSASMLQVQGDGTLDIPRNYVGITAHALSSLKSKGVKKVFIPSSVRNIMPNAFAMLDSLEEVVFADGTDHIDNYALCGCKQLKRIGIPASVKRIGAGAFMNLPLLQGIRLPAELDEISDELFSGCTSLAHIAFGDKIRRIGAGAFYGCSSLRTIMLPDSVESIGISAFWECVSLQRLYIPADTKTLSQSSLSNCPALMSLYMPRIIHDQLETKRIFGDVTNPTITWLDDDVMKPDWQDDDDLPEIIAEEVQEEIPEVPTAPTFELPNAPIQSAFTAAPAQQNQPAVQPAQAADAEKVRQLEETIATLQQQMAVITQNAAENAETHEVKQQNESQIALNSSAIETLNQNLNALQEKMDAAQDSAAAISSIQEQVASIASMQSKVEEIAAMQENVQKKVNAISDIQEKVDVISELQETVGVISDVQEKVEAIPEIQQNIEALSDMHKKVDALSDMQEQMQTISEIQKKVEAISDVRDKVDAIAEVQEKVSMIPEIQQKVDALSEIQQLAASDSVADVSPDSQAVPALALSAVDNTDFISGTKFVSVHNGEYPASENVFTYVISKPMPGPKERSAALKDYSVIAYRSFRTTEGGERFEIPEGVRRVETQGFWDCPRLLALELPLSLQEVEPDAFSGCSRLTDVYLAEDFPDRQAVEYFLFRPEVKLHWPKKSVFSKPRICTVAELMENFDDILTASKAKKLQVRSHVLHVPEGYTVIAPNAFLEIDARMDEPEHALKTIFLPHSLRRITARAFSGMEMLRHIVMPEGLQIVDMNAFTGCLGPHRIVLPDSVTYIGPYAFAAPCQYEQIRLPKSLQSLPENAFSNCNTLVCLRIPESVQSIGEMALSGCTNLTSLTIPKKFEEQLPAILDGPVKINVRWTEDSDDVDLSNVPTGLLDILEPKFQPVPEQRLFTYEISAQCANYAERLTQLHAHPFVASYALTDMANQTKFEIPLGVLRLCSYAFGNNNRLLTLIVPKALTEFEYAAFYGCEKLRDVFLPDEFDRCAAAVLFMNHPQILLSFGNTRPIRVRQLTHDCPWILSAGDSAELQMENGTIRVPNGYLVIASYMYHGIMGQEGLRRIEVAQSVRLIGKCSFVQLPELEEIVCSDGLLAVEPEAIINCLNLKRVVFPSTLQFIGDSVLFGCINVESVVLPKRFMDRAADILRGCPNAEVTWIDDAVPVEIPVTQQEETIADTVTSDADAIQDEQDFADAFLDELINPDRTTQTDADAEVPEILVPNSEDVTEEVFVEPQIEEADRISPVQKTDANAEAQIPVIEEIESIADPYAEIASVSEDTLHVQPDMADPLGLIVPEEIPEAVETADVTEPEEIREIAEAVDTEDDLADPAEESADETDTLFDDLITEEADALTEETQQAASTETEADSDEEQIDTIADALFDELIPEELSEQDEEIAQAEEPETEVSAEEIVTLADTLFEDVDAEDVTLPDEKITEATEEDAVSAEPADEIEQLADTLFETDEAEDDIADEDVLAEESDSDAAENMLEPSIEIQSLADHLSDAPSPSTAGSLLLSDIDEPGDTQYPADVDEFVEEIEGITLTEIGDDTDNLDRWTTEAPEEEPKSDLDLLEQISEDDTAAEADTLAALEGDVAEETASSEPDTSEQPQTLIPEDGKFTAKERRKLYHGEQELHIPAGYTEIRAGACAALDDLETLILPDTVTRIGSGAFADSAALRSVYIPLSVTDIADDAFDGCDAIKEVTMPLALEAMAGELFSDNVKITWLQPEKAEITIIGDGRFTAKIRREIYQDDDTLVIPEGYTEIRAGACAGLDNLSAVTLPETLEKICAGAFADCTNLSELVIPSGVTKLEEDAFEGCIALKQVTAPKHLEEEARICFPDAELIFV